MNTLTAGEIIELLKQVHPTDKVMINVEPVKNASNLLGDIESDQPIAGMKIVGSQFGYRAVLELGEIE